MAKNDNSYHKRKAMWDQMRKVQEAMSSAVQEAVHQRSSGTRPANRADTTSVAQRQVAKEEWKEGESPRAHHANKAQQTRAGNSPRGNVSTQTRLDKGLLKRCDKAGCGRAYAKPVQLINNYKEEHPNLGLKRSFICE